MDTFEGRCGRDSKTLKLDAGKATCLKIVNLGDCTIRVTFFDKDGNPVKTTADKEKTYFDPPGAVDPDINSKSKAKRAAAEKRMAGSVCCAKAASVELACGREQASSTADEKSPADKKDCTFRYDVSDCDCVCAVEPSSCCFKMSWRDDPTFRFGLRHDKAGKVIQRYVQGTPERIDIELVSKSGKTGDCHIIQRVYQKAIYSAPLDQTTIDAQLGPTATHPKRTFRRSGDKMVITEDPLDYDETRNLVNAAGNVTINDRPNDWVSRDNDTDPILVHIETLFVVWCKEAPSVRGSWGYGFDVDWATGQGDFYRWTMDCDGFHKPEETHAEW